MILDKEELLKIVNTLPSHHEIIGPVEEENGLYFRSVESSEQIVWEFANTVNNIKDFFFPPRQELYELRSDRVVCSESNPSSNRIILFPRACDVKALTLMDRLFIGEYEDPSYKQYRENTVIIGLSCLEPDKRCFCLSLGGGPFQTEGMDASITPLGNSLYSIQLITEKAKEFWVGESGFGAAKGRQRLFPASILAAGDPITAEDKERPKELKNMSESAIKREINIPENMVESFDSEYWREVSQSCVSCGICSYLCPTCHCFDIVDEGYLRVRCWDTCSSNTFTRMAAGEDHRKEKYKRYRQRVFHKFDYYKDNFGAVACVGCGRCTTYCPVKMDIVEIVNNL